jgi:alpha-galactosidase
MPSLSWLTTALLACSTSVWAAGPEPIAANWTAEGLRSLRVARATASSTVGPQYAPEHAVDGSRSSKWVAATAASTAAPQSITLELFGPQNVSTVALFGEAPGNDGVRDAQVQVADAASGQFSTVATVTDAPGRSWLVRFAPRKATAVRLLITRSGGRSTHTDVYKIELYGPPLTAAELEAYAAAHLRALKLQAAKVAEVAKMPIIADDASTESHRVLEAFKKQVENVSRRMASFATLTVDGRQSLVEDIERLENKARRVPAWLATAAAAGPAQRRDIESVRREGRQMATGDKAIAVREGRAVRVVNRHLLLGADTTSDRWGVTWLGDVKGAVHGLRCGVDLVGAPLLLQGGKCVAAPFADKLGAGVEVRHLWGAQVSLERRLRVYDNRPAVAVSAHITNASPRPITLRTVRMVDLDSAGGRWSAGTVMFAPAAVGYPGTTPPCQPAPDGGGPGDAAVGYSAAGTLALRWTEPAGAMVVGFLTGQQAQPSVHARFEPGKGGTALTASLPFRDRLLEPGESLALDTVWLSAEPDAFAALSHYADAVAACATRPVRTGANALWCSWYPLRMSISEDIVLANAAVAARHFKPLGLELMQLDHGWQRGDVCGDWVPNERFPHGMKWLSEQLATRFGMKLGLWIAPTVVAGSSDLFRDHPDWMLRNADGKPAPTGRWFWKPNPESYVLDASHPGAAEWLRSTFSRLTAEGSCYYKIDFITGCGGGFERHDPHVTRGWGVLRKAMEQIRAGTGPEAWIRYCQTPPLLSLGLAHSAYIGIDTGDAGMAGTMKVLRENAQLLAASYWVNDRLYHREVCDMSVGMAAGLEEARLRLALMTLTGCSISFSDDFRKLPPERIQLMQQCLPAGNPSARPLDLFDRQIPSLWHMPCVKRGLESWDVVGLFNFEDQPQERTLDLAAIGLAPNARVAVFEFWQQKFLGLHAGRVSLTLPPHSSRVLVVRRLAGRPQLMATDMHLLAGYHEIDRLAWDDARATLSGQCRRAPGLAGKLLVYVPAGWRPADDASTDLGGGLWSHTLRFDQATAGWQIRFARSIPGK